MVFWLFRLLLLHPAGLLHLALDFRGRSFNLAAELPPAAELPQILVDSFYFLRHFTALPLALVQLLPLLR